MCRRQAVSCLLTHCCSRASPYLKQVHDDFMQKRQLGGAVTLVTCAILAVLVYCASIALVSFRPFVCSSSGLTITQH